MPLGSFRHLMLYVKNISLSREFYQQIMGFLGYSLAHESDSYCMWNPNIGGCSFGIVQADAESGDTIFQRGEPGFHHLAFNANNREQIDDLYAILLKMQAKVLDPPGECPEYSPTYYAMYFEDPDGMKLELAYS